MDDMTGKIALVTGGGSGIGHGAALAFAKRGASVAILDIEPASAETVAAEIVGNGGDAFAVRCDVRRLSEIRTAFEAVLDHYGGVDVAFNNAGIGGAIAPMANLDDDEWDNVIATNLTSIWHFMRIEIAHMVERGGGAIVNCASIAGLVGLPGMAAYCASKHGILGMTKVAALDYATRGIRINAVCPGIIRTPAMEAFEREHPAQAAEFLGQMVKGEPIGRLGTPGEVGEAVAWLCGPGASFMLGHGLVVDGGYVAQ
jgi:NAD(P)-dependent dehydrogenase (short-subunit alcohol dehydrogenase family)